MCVVVVVTGEDGLATNSNKQFLGKIESFFIFVAVVVVVGVVIVVVVVVEVVVM